MANKGESAGFVDLRRFIGKQVRGLRNSRGFSQGELGKVFGIPQTRLSDIEAGKGSLSAEEFIHVLRFFNVSAGYFDSAPGEAGGALHKALAGHGATHLVEDPSILPSEKLAQVDSAIQETLVTGESARALTALAPVIITHAGQINFHKLFVRFKEFGLECRYGWLLDNLLEAIEATLRAPNREGRTRGQTLALTRAARLLQEHRGRVFPLGSGPSLSFEDWLGAPAASPKTKREVAEKLSDLSKRWSIFTTISVDDFAKAIKESGVVDPH